MSFTGVILGGRGFATNIGTSFVQILALDIYHGILGPSSKLPHCFKPMFAQICRGSGERKLTEKRGTNTCLMSLE